MEFDLAFTTISDTDLLIFDLLEYDDLFSVYHVCRWTQFIMDVNFWKRRFTRTFSFDLEPKVSFTQGSFDFQENQKSQFNYYLACKRLYKTTAAFNNCYLVSDAFLAVGYGYTFWFESMCNDNSVKCRYQHYLELAIQKEHLDIIQVLYKRRLADRKEILESAAIKGKSLIIDSFIKPSKKYRDSYFFDGLIWSIITKSETSQDKLYIPSIGQLITQRPTDKVYPIRYNHIIERLVRFDNIECVRVIINAT